MSKTFKKLSVIKKTTNFKEAVEVVEVPLIPPRDDQILLKIIYAGVNASDINITAARFYTDGKFPFDIGLEALGIIDAFGKDVTGFRIGQPAVVFGFVLGAYAEYLYVKKDEVIAVPSLKPEFIALLVGGLTASIGADVAGRFKKGDKVLITAAAGGTGHIAVQWAKQKGCYVIGLTSTSEKAKLLKELGTDRVINYKTEDLSQVLTKEYPTGVNVIWETIGGQVFETLFKHLAPEGRFVTLGGISGYEKDGFPDVTIPNLPLKLALKNQSLIGFAMPWYKELHRKYLAQQIEQVATNKLRVVLDLGTNTNEGEFKGIDSVVRGLDVRLKQITVSRNKNVLGFLFLDEFNL